MSRETSLLPPPVDSVRWPDSTTQLLKMVHLIVGYEPRDTSASITG